MLHIPDHPTRRVGRSHSVNRSAKCRCRLEFCLRCESATHSAQSLRVENIYISVRVYACVRVCVRGWKVTRRIANSQPERHQLSGDTEHAARQRGNTIALAGSRHLNADQELHPLAHSPVQTDPSQPGRPSNRSTAGNSPTIPEQYRRRGADDKAAAITRTLNNRLCPALEVLCHFV
jgi:hypothetical protein